MQEASATLQQKYNNKHPPKADPPQKTMDNLKDQTGPDPDQSLEHNESGYMHQMNDIELLRLLGRADREIDIPVLVTAPNGRETTARLTKEPGKTPILTTDNQYELPLKSTSSYALDNVTFRSLQPSLNQDRVALTMETLPEPTDEQNYPHQVPAKELAEILAQPTVEIDTQVIAMTPGGIRRTIRLVKENGKEPRLIITGGISILFRENWKYSLDDETFKALEIAEIREKVTESRKRTRARIMEGAHSRRVNTAIMEEAIQPDRTTEPPSPSKPVDQIFDPVAKMIKADNAKAEEARRAAQQPPPAPRKKPAESKNTLTSAEQMAIDTIKVILEVTQNLTGGSCQIVREFNAPIAATIVKPTVLTRKEWSEQITLMLQSYGISTVIFDKLENFGTICSYTISEKGLIELAKEVGLKSNITANLSNASPKKVGLHLEINPTQLTNDTGFTVHFLTT